MNRLDGKILKNQQGPPSVFDEYSETTTKAVAKVGWSLSQWCGRCRRTRAGESLCFFFFLFFLLLRERRGVFSPFLNGFFSNKQHFFTLSGLSNIRNQLPW
jgi:hypothetical protein